MKEKELSEKEELLAEELAEETEEAELAEEYPIEEAEENVIRVKEFDLKPMSAEEAIVQMDLLDHSFFVFNDSETDQTCVVYRRDNGGYGLIVPKE